VTIEQQLLIILAAAIITLAAASVLSRFGIPIPVVLVVAGLIVGFLPFVPDVSLEPHVVLLGLLPLLVFETAATSSPRAFARNAGPIGMLAIVLVGGTAAVVATAAHFVAHLTWPMAWVLGTAVGPTDVVAATSIGSRLGLPRRLLTILEGEALFNDASALVLYGAAVAAITTGQFSPLHAAGKIVYSSVVGVAIGLAAGVASHVSTRWLRDPSLEVLASLLTAYAAFLPAQAAGASGVLAAVTAGLFLGWQSSGSVSAQSRLRSSVFWSMLIFLVNGVLFILVGLSFHTFTTQARGSVGRLLAGLVAVAAAVVVVRLVVVFGTGWFLRPQGHGDHDHAGWRERVVLGWGGMRGALTLAAALAVPRLDNHGLPLVGRVDMIYLAFGVIGVTLLGQGMTLPLVVRALGLREAESVAELERQARLELARAALRRLDELTEDRDLPETLTEPLRAQFVARARQLQLHAGDTDDSTQPPEELRAFGALRRELVAEQRRVLLQLRRLRQIVSTTLHAIERDLDLEETRLH